MNTMTPTPNRKALSDLLQRVEEGTGPDRALDIDIWEAVTGREWIDNACSPNSEEIGDYTASLDACVALVERVLPGWHVELKKFSDGWYAALARKSTDSGYDFYRGTQKPAAIALLIALIRTLLNKETET